MPFLTYSTTNAISPMGRLIALARPSALGAFLVVAIGCGRVPSARTNVSAISPPATRHEQAVQTNAPPESIPVYSYEVVNVWPHDRKAFTQGLVFLNGTLLESTGLNGQSTLRKVDLTTGTVQKRVEVPAIYFAEGLAVLGGKIFQLTWQNGEGFVYDLETFQIEKEFAYEGEGWGLTTDNQWLILSDGTPQIRFLDPVTFEVKRTINVLSHGQPVSRLNELEFINGEIYANVWQTDYVVRINPATGQVVGAIDFTGLLSNDERTDTDVLNGIAYDATNHRLFITGKLWPKLFEVRLKPRP
jgi:glutaminyl-peptide cyclotransferase